MYSIPHDFKQLLFDKEAEELLTPNEQALWEEFVESEQPQNAQVDPDDPIFRDALRLYMQFEEENIAPWREFKRTVMPKRGTRVVIYRMYRILTIRFSVIAKAAAVLLLTLGVFWLYQKYWSTDAGYMSVKTPNGRLDSLKLSDGTMVYLNAASALRYRASGNERRVELSGEAYFKINHNPSKPFHVVIGKTEVKDLGTEFNIKAYPDDERVIITLVEGQAEVKYAQQTKHLGPAPGQQAIVQGDSIALIQHSTLENMLAWKQGFIALEGETLLSVMQQIQRCYNVGFKFIGQPRPLDLTAKIPKTRSLAAVIDILNNAADLNDAVNSNDPKDKPFQLEGNTIIIRGN